MDKILLEQVVSEYLSGNGTLTQLERKFKINKSIIKSELLKLGYVIKSGYKLSTVLGLKSATEEYIKQYNNGETPSLTKISSQFKINRKVLSDRLKELNIEVINYQNKSKFDECVFDSIDNEEKAYWLGFIFADGCISSRDNAFELSLKGEDIEHLHKFNTFMGHIHDNVKLSTIKSNNTEYTRCR